MHPIDRMGCDDSARRAAAHSGTGRRLWVRSPHTYADGELTPILNGGREKVAQVADIKETQRGLERLLDEWASRTHRLLPH